MTDPILTRLLSSLSSTLGERLHALLHVFFLAEDEHDEFLLMQLQELRDSWQAVDGFVHVNRFRRFEGYQALCAASGLQVLTLERQARVLHFPDLRALTHELKALGAHNLNPGRPDGLTGRARIRALVEAYEHFRQAAGLPATYQVVYGVLRRPD